MSDAVAFARSKGYPLRIIGNDGYKATLVNIQPLGGGDFVGIYRYPGGVCCHGLNEITNCYTILEW